VSLERAEALARRIRPRDGLLPHVTGDDGRWRLLSPLDAEDAALTGLPWTGGFVAGQLWLAGEHERAAAVTELLRPRAAQPTTHDLGFLFWPSALLGLRSTGDDCYRVLGLRAAASLVARALPNGVIQVIGLLDDPGYRGRTIVDTWPNLLLLWWAERAGLAEAGEAARAHLDATLPALLRDDGSTFHAARLADDGSVLEQGTINGFSASSTWARGQAWAMHGLATAYRATGDYGEQAERAARWFLDHLPECLVPPWDFGAPGATGLSSSDRLKPVTAARRDASAGAIAASALLELGWEDDARRLLDALVAGCLNRGESDGVLLHCCYRYPLGHGLDCATVWGDFFLLDALKRVEAPQRRRAPRG
jgi:unsaturated chondroitin disaccharide hydrolase